VKKNDIIFISELQYYMMAATERIYFKHRSPNLAERFRRGQLGTMFIKPGFFPNDPHGRPLQSAVEALLTSSKIDILESTELILTPEGVRKLYRGIFAATEPSDTLLEVRRKILDYLASAPILFYLLSGEDIVGKLNLIKTDIRARYGLVKGSAEVRTILHVPEEEEIMHDINLFVLYRTGEFVLPATRRKSE
jgi:hypothetical protein